MILTVTMNPAIDISYRFDTLKIDTINRVDDEIKTAGGKGLNVAKVLNLLKEPVIATGLLGGNIGAFIESKLDEDNIKHDFYHTKENSRINVAIIHDNGQQTEILEGGPTFDKKSQKDFLNHFIKLIENVKLITISGSLAKGLDTDYYKKMLDIAADKNKKVILDCSGQALKESLLGENKPFAIKPNEEEISWLLGNETIISKDNIPKIITENPLFKDVPWVVVTYGGQGAIAKVNGVVYNISVPKIDVVSPVGSGDSTVAGMAYGIAQNKSIIDTLKTAMTTGILNTLEAKTGFINPDNFDLYFDKIVVEEL